MKVMFYINAIHDGGAERVMINLADRFARFGHEVILVTSFVDKWEYEIPSGVKRLNLCDNIPKGFLKRNLLLYRLLRKVVKCEAPDVLVSFMAEPNFRALLATRGLKTKNLISIRNDPNKEYPTKKFRFFARWLYKKADGIVFQTADAKAWFSKKIQNKSKIIYNQVNEKFYEENLIHKTKNGIMVRSKSEVIIANMLYDSGYENFLYEEKLPLGDSFKLPDFTIRDAASGLFVIWEHLGMLGDEEYRKAWEAKKQVYEANGFSEKNGNLIVTMDSLDGGIDCQEIQRKINEYLG